MKKNLYYILSAIIVLTACTNSEESNIWNDVDKTDSILSVLMKNRNLDRLFSVVDSLEQTGCVERRHADYLRARGCDMCWKVGLARYYYSKVFLSYSKPIEDWDGYADAGYRLSVMRREQNDYEGALGVATQLLLEAEDEPRFPKLVNAFLHANVADCQLRLLQYDDAQQNYLKGYDIIRQLTVEEGGVSNKGNLLIMSIGVCDAYLDMGNAVEASVWLQHSEDALSDYINEKGDTDFIEEYKGHIAIARASIEYVKGNDVKANEIFDAIPENQIQVPRSVSEASKYLMLSGRYADAANRYAWLDSLYDKEGYQMNFSQIMDDMVPRFEAKLKSGNDKEALKMAEEICQAIGTAINNSYRDNSQELSVLFGLHERELAEKKEIYMKEVWRVIALFSVLLSLLFCVGFWFFHKQRRNFKVKTYRMANNIRKQKMKLTNEVVQERTQETLPPAVEEVQGSDKQAKMQKRTEFLQNLYFRLCDILEQEKTFTNPELKREDLAAMLGTNYKYVGDAIRECTSGMSINEFINMKRLEYASHLLRHTDWSVIQISDSVGFNNRSYFNRLFREYYKMTPSEWREKSAN